MSKKTTGESNTDTAKKVVTAKQRYFVPSHLREVEADDLAGVEKKLKKKQEEDGDANS